MLDNQGMYIYIYKVYMYKVVPPDLSTGMLIGCTTQLINWFDL